MKKLLLIRFSALGDVAMLAPVVKEVSVSMPDVEVTVLSQPFCAPLFEGLGSNVRFIGADIRGEYHGIKGLGRLFRRLNAVGYDYIADMHGVLRTHYLSMRFRLAGYRVAQIDKERSSRRALTAPEGKKKMVQLRTSFEKYRDVLRRLGMDGMERFEEYVSSHSGERVISFESVDSEVEQLLREPCNSDDRCYRIGIAPFAAHAGKVYPLDKMERVIDHLLSERSDVVIYLFGGGGEEREKMLSWQSRWQGRVVAASPRLCSMRRELQLMSRLSVMLSMDSGNMHLASLVGTRVVSVWGATHPFAGFLGWGQREADCVQLSLPCRPCSVFGKAPCRRGDFACMRGIEERAVVACLVDRMLR